MKQSLRKIMRSKPASDPGYLFHTNLNYPTIEGNEANFIEDYQDNAASYNGYALLKRGSQVIDIDSEDYPIPWDYLSEMSGFVTDVKLDSWARLYYALSLSYNPLYNVDGSTIRETSAKRRTDEYGATSGENRIGAISSQDVHGAKSGSTSYGATSSTDNIGAKSQTLGDHTDVQTAYSVSYNGASEQETGKTSSNLGSQIIGEAARTDSHSETAHSDTHNEAAFTDTHSENARADSHSEASHSDTHNEAAYTETETRSGNIGVTMTQQLLDAEWEFRKKSFFEMIINELLDTLGFYYEGGIGL